MMERDHARPIGARIEQHRVPEFGLRAGVAKNERRSACLDFAYDRSAHRRAQVPGPGNPHRTLRGKRVDPRSAR